MSKDHQEKPEGQNAAVEPSGPQSAGEAALTGEADSAAEREAALWIEITKAMPRQRWAWSVFRDAQRWSVARDPIAHFSNNKTSKRLKPFIARAETSMLPGLIARAEIAEDHAAYLLRIILVANITIPISIVLLANQLVPEGLLLSVAEKAERLFVYGTFISAFTAAGIFVLHAMGGVRAFRNIKQLMVLEQARRRVLEVQEAQDQPAPTHAAGADLIGDMVT